MPGAKPYTLRDVSQHPLSRMLPLKRYQMQAYRLGEKLPPSALDGHGPTWEAVTLTLAQRGTLQARVNLQRDFTLIGISASSSSNANGGFRAQLYDMKKQVRFADRGAQFSQFAASAAVAGGNPILLREPYRFDEPDSQIYVAVQNLEIVTNTVQIVFYGQALRFNELSANDFPGGTITSAWGAAMGGH